MNPLIALACALTLLSAQEHSPGPAVQESSSCALCHSNADRATAMRTASGHGVAPYDLWQGTMMANSARDPLWRAAVSAEIAAHPSRRSEIERTCLSCHAPMASRVGLEDHGTGTFLHLLDCESELGDVARDGVSCTICHGIVPARLGTNESFSGRFDLDDERRLFGPHEDPFSMPMFRHTGFTAAHGSHLTESALCGSCHTLETEALGPEGELLEIRFLEQAPYLEWLNSDFRAEGPDPGPLAAHCQECHVPTVDATGQTIRTRIARNPGGFDFPPTRNREPFGRHLFVGGNTLVLEILRNHSEELHVEASPAALQATLAATRDQLRHRTARVSIEEARREGGTLRFDVAVENLTGHKLPTGHPTRRAWLRVVVRDEYGTVRFTSGATDAQGRIVGADGQPLAAEMAGGPLLPHHDVVRSSDEVATYQAVLADAEGHPTHTLLEGASWWVDDRLLPSGWSPGHAQALRTAPVGVEGDVDFAAGGDRVHYEIRVDRGPAIKVEVALLYQSLDARWAAELMRWETPEIQDFRRFYATAERVPEVLAMDTRTLPRAE